MSLSKKDDERPEEYILVSTAENIDAVHDLILFDHRIVHVDIGIKKILAK